MRDGWNPRTQQTQQMYTSSEGFEWYFRSVDYGGKVCSNGCACEAHMLTFTVRVSLGLGLQCQINNLNPHQKTKCMPNSKRLPGCECCATALLSAQEDLKSTRSRLQEIVEIAGHISVLYPKFHGELNWIGYYWGG